MKKFRVVCGVGFLILSAFLLDNDVSLWLVAASAIAGFGLVTI